MGRREAITLGGSALFERPLVARAQQPAKIARLGYLGFGARSDQDSTSCVEALRVGLREFGYVEGKNLGIEFRWLAPLKRCTKPLRNWSA
jgi:putative ABC transport system substrate-binding protein